MQEAWRPTLQCVAAKGGGSRVAVVSPSLPRAVAVTVTTVASALVVILVPMAEVASKVTLAAPPPPIAVEEERETGLPASLGGGPHGSPSRSELEVLGGDAARMESECLSMAHETGVVEIPSDGEAGDEVEPPVPS